MKDKNIIIQFADLLIKRKRKIRAIQYVLIISFICLSLGIIVALPFRFFLGLPVQVALIIVFLIILLTFIYGFLGIENRIDVLRYADIKMDLNEKLSAAYQYADSGNPYASLILNDAIDIIEKTKINQVFYVKFSKRDPFQPLLLSLFFFLWMSSFSFLQISENNMASGEFLVDIAGKIDAVNSEIEDKDIDDIAEEYRKLGKKIQDRFMNDKSIEDEVEELSRKLEKKIEDLSREGVNKESQTLNDDEAENEVFQLKRKQEMSEELQDIFEDLMNTFSMKSGSASETKRRGDPSDSENGDQVILSEEEIAAINKKEESDNAEESSSMEGLDNKIEQEESSESSENSDSGETDKPAKSTLEKNDPQNQESDNKETQSNELQSEESSSENMAPGEQKGDDGSYERQDREERQSGEFNEENIRGKLQDGEQMKSFIRALPHIVDPSLQDKEIIYYYRNQLETAIENEILPEGYESVIRDYFLGIGVLNE